MVRSVLGRTIFSKQFVISFSELSFPFGSKTNVCAQKEAYSFTICLFWEV